MRRSLNELSNRSGITEFTAVGQRLLIGAALTIVFFGIILIGIAFITLANAFSKIKNTQPTSPTTIETSSPPPLLQSMSTSVNTEVKAYCPYCGTPLPPEAHFCTQCGKQT